MPGMGRGPAPGAEEARQGSTMPTAALLLAPASIFSLMATNLNQTAFADVLPTLAGTLAFAAAAWLASVALAGRADAKAATIAALWVAGALFHLALFGPINAWLDGGYAMLRSLPLALGVLGLATLVVLRLPQPVAGALHVVLSAIALAVCATPLWNAVAYEWRHGEARRVYDADRAAAVVEGAPVQAAAAVRPPDIYHFVFDRYGSAETLRHRYGIEEDIGAFLKERGFHVAQESHSNYLRTGHSLASTFHMDYLDALAGDPRIPSDSWHPILQMLDDHRAGRFLKARGYRMIQFGSWWVGTFDSAIADENHPYGFSEFAMLYLRRTMLRPIFHALPDTALTMRLDWDNGQCQRVPRQIERIKAIGRQEEPVYVFAHILVPHGPYIFESDGGCLTPEEAIERGSERGYASQIAYANRIIEDVVTSLQAPGRPAPIILIQADEGPFPQRDAQVPWQDALPEELRIKTGILHALYFPNRDYGQLSPQTTPVNLYRIVFNAHFGTSFDLLSDRVFAFPNDVTLYEFYDVTERARSQAHERSSRRAER